MPTIQVSNEQQLNQAIATVDATTTSGVYTIELTANITEGTDTGDAITFGTQNLSAPPQLYAIILHAAVEVDIDGNGYTLDGTDPFHFVGNGGAFVPAISYPGLFVYSGTSPWRTSPSRMRWPGAATAQWTVGAVPALAVACLWLLRPRARPTATSR